MRITFIGANHEVTGSCTLLEVNNRYYLVDCGMEQGQDVFENVPLPVAPSGIDAVFLTHAHIDHSGMLPKLCKDGFCGSIYATSATADLCSIMLADSAHIQEADAEWLSRKNARAGGEKAKHGYFPHNLCLRRDVPRGGNQCNHPTGGTADSRYAPGGKAR